MNEYKELLRAAEEIRKEVAYIAEGRDDYVGNDSIAYLKQCSDSLEAAIKACEALPSPEGCSKFHIPVEGNICGYSSNGVNVWGDEASLSAVRAAFHAQSNEGAWRNEVKNARDAATRAERMKEVGE